MGAKTPNIHKRENTPRHDLKGRLAARGVKFAQFARQKEINVRTLYSVLDGYRKHGPVAKRIIEAIKAA